MKCQESNGLKIKHEPSTDIVAYSPTQDPESQFFYEINDQVKKEIKTEPGKGKFELNFDAYWSLLLMTEVYKVDYLKFKNSYLLTRNTVVVLLFLLLLFSLFLFK